MSKRTSKFTIDPVEFIDRIKRDEKGEPFSLASAEVLAKASRPWSTRFREKGRSMIRHLLLLERYILRRSTPGYRPAVTIG